MLFDFSLQRLSADKRNEWCGREMRREGKFLSKLFLHLFYIHLLLISILVIFLTVRSVLSAAHTHHFQPKNWYILVFSSTSCAGIIGFSWQAFATFNPSRTLKATFWLSPLLTCAFGILLVSIGTPGSLAASVIALVFSVLQSLYACWVNPRFEHSSRILTVSTAYHPLKVKTSVVLSIIASTLYSSFLMAGIGGATATGTMVDTLFIILILGSLTWTTQIIKNMIQVTVSHIKYMQFTCGIEVDFKAVVKTAAKYSIGNICIGSILVPVCDVIRGTARAVSLISGDVDEFMFSCANCCSGVASRIVAYGNRWGFVHVGVYNKGIVQASMDTWEMFRRVGMEKLINSDLTSSFCFLSGVAAGSICALLGGTWALVIHRNYATQVCIYAFLTGYFTNRVAMAWVQASIMAYYVAYAENPQSQQFDTTITTYMQELQRSQV
ncbi:Plasma-membrane choline transporter family protein [Perilla frutescens var. frutescens]|nr:Plasma-membrane choline transporter family protein [Perilla frutescens var. frutescens]